MEKFHEYDWMLKRAREKLPKTEGKVAKFEIPKAEVLVQGNKTMIRNFGEIADILNRKADHMIKFLAHELGTSGNLDGTRVFFTGKFGPMTVNQKLESYVKEFVLCPACGRNETQLLREGRISLLRCTACGARSSVRTLS